MDSSVERAAVTPNNKSRFIRTFAKVLHLRTATGVAPDVAIHKVKTHENVKVDYVSGSRSMSFDDDDKKNQNRAAMEALLAKLFASVSAVKAAYAELQIAQSPYDADEIQSSDQMVVSELKNLSELKQCFLKKQFDSSPGTTLLLAEIQEQKSLLRTYEITMSKLDSQRKLKESEIMFLREKLEESNKHNRMLEKRLNRSGLLHVLDNLRLSGLNPSHFITVLRHTVKSIRSYIRLMINEMESAGWDLDASASVIEPGVHFWGANHKCFAVEAFVCREMFDGFQHPNFSLPNESLPEQRKRQCFFSRFMELKAAKPMEFLAQKPKSAFAKFCRIKYLQLVHPRMESSFFGSLSQRSLVNSGEFPETAFFISFAEMAKRVWLLHCLAFSFEPEASIFQVKKKSQFSEVYMESVTDEATPSYGGDSPKLDSPEPDQLVAFTVVPGFRIGKTVIQCQVYLSHP
ncbi:protein GRAVITROPIC IN THE LIGHT 1-like [Malania oleifera]|uniref:protein GRAVITROPIC IN THE LIGHT 1-like n=1 Tax=Malania oleifera TaxID=397392 RepID=UPI0025AE0BC5|nr:protein GRAVITROPIC IN THE LIGHT 1-like [Malania oleifera]